MGIVCSGRLPTRSLATPRSTCNLEGNVAIIFTSMPRSSKCSTPTTTRTRRRSSITSSGCAVREFGGHNSNSRRCAKNTRLMRLFTKRACPPMRWSWQRWRLAAFSCPTTTASTTTASALHPTWHGVRRQSFCPCGRSAAPRPRVERKVRLSTESVSSCPQILPPPPLSSARRLRALPETLWLQQRPCLEERSAMHRRTLATPLRPRARPLVMSPFIIARTVGVACTMPVLGTPQQAHPHCRHSGAGQRAADSDGDGPAKSAATAAADGVTPASRSAKRSDRKREKQVAEDRRRKARDAREAAAAVEDAGADGTPGEALLSLLTKQLVTV
mmetsp:Transcript_93690/g.301504  ORF Transcript_93690/g.301504 Transcript_93690/m.301504 type:complete len:330 (-) Transcript_93690:54-1043(-)